MAQITWRNIDGSGIAQATANYGNAQNAFGQTIQQGFDRLANIGSNFASADLARQNAIKEANTQYVINQMNQAQSLDQFNNMLGSGQLDLTKLKLASQGQFNEGKFNTNFQQRSDTLYGRDLGERKFGLESQQAQLDEARHNYNVNKDAIALQTEATKNLEKGNSAMAQAYQAMDQNTKSELTKAGFDANNIGELTPEIISGLAIGAGVKAKLMEAHNYISTGNA